MGIAFSADEIFRVAEKIEANGAAFYRRAAQLCTTRPGADIGLLLKLAETEENHRSTFAAMRAELSDRMREETASDPYTEASLYLEELADSHGGEGAPGAAAKLTGDETMEELLGQAIGLEQKSIIFYLGLKDRVPKKLGRDKIDTIIAEERQHMVLLTDQIKVLRGEA